MEWNTALTVPLRAGDFGPCQTARTHDLDTLGTAVQGRLDGFLHGPAEGHALFQLSTNALGNQLCVGLGMLLLIDVDPNLFFRKALEFFLQLVDLGPLFADNNAGARG